MQKYVSIYLDWFRWPRWESRHGTHSSNFCQISGVGHISHPNLDPMLHPKPGPRRPLLYEGWWPVPDCASTGHGRRHMLQPESDPSQTSTALDSLVQLRATENWWAWTLNERDYLDFLKTSLSPIITQSAPTACLRIASDYHFSSVGRGVAEHSIFGTAGETGSPDSRGKFCPQRQETISFHQIV